MNTDYTLTQLNDRLLTSENAWTAAAFVAALVAAGASRGLLKRGWEATTGTAAPISPDAEDATWVESLIWGIITGAAIGIVRALARHGASSARRHFG